MGNCMVIQDRNREIKIMSMDVDGEILKLPPPPPPLNGVSSSSDDEALRPATADMADDPPGGAVVRVKLVVRKQELKKMLLHNDAAAISLNDMVSLMQKQAEADELLHQQESCGSVWQPTLQSIPEGSVF
uniref:Uncharacterized protein n=1 Tax=Oryza glumipatula TaxID=40148 RepID=A0A0E0BP40_9ORYZ